MFDRNGKSQEKVAEYVIVGAGPAAITTIPNLLKRGVLKTDIIWIDPQFKVGEFGTSLSVGSSVPGNTAVENYHKVYNEIYKMIPECAPGNKTFEIDSLEPSFVCSLKIATKPMQHITNGLRTLVSSVVGKVTNIITTKEGLSVEVTLSDGTSRYIKTKRAILATGAQPRTLKLPIEMTVIDPNVAFIETELANYLLKHPGINTVAVIGSSHSAALATMQLLKAGMVVKQFMNKDYRYATPTVSPEGIKYIRFDNTGLKGDVAKFTRKLLEDIKADRGDYQGKLTIYQGKNSQEVNILMKNHLAECCYAVVTIGYDPADTLKVNGQPLSTLSHNNKTTEFKDVKGLFGIGVGFPQEVKAISGEIEPGVGVGKFWATASNPNIFKIWENNPAEQNIENFNLADSTQTLFKRAMNQPSRCMPTCAFQPQSKL